MPAAPKWCWATMNSTRWPTPPEWPADSGKFLRPHDDPSDPWSASNERQHKAFLEQVVGEDRERYLAWFWTLPLWLDLGDLRVVHACWHADSIAVCDRELGGSASQRRSSWHALPTDSDPFSPR